MSGYEAGKYKSFEEAWEGGRRYEIERQREAESGEGGNDDSGGLTMEQLQNMSEEEHIARREEIDKALEGGLVRGANVEN